MNPLDRSLTPPSPQQEVQASSSQQTGSSQRTESSLQANITNVGAASASRPATIPLIASASQFQPVPLHSNLIQSFEGNLYYVLNALDEGVMAALLGQGITLGSEGAVQQIDEHRVLLNGIHIPVFLNPINTLHIISSDRVLLHTFIQEVFTRLAGLKCYYNRTNFICSLLLLADNQRVSLQEYDELEKVIESYIPNPGGNVYLQSNWNIDWPNSQEVRKKHDREKSYVDSITPEIKKHIYLKMEELDHCEDKEVKGRHLRRIHYIDAAFTYGTSPNVVRTWVTSGKKLHEEQIAAKEQLIASEQRSSVLEQPQAAEFNPGIVINDDQRPGPSRSERRASTLRFAPYQRHQPQAPSIDPNIQTQAATLGLTAETLQAFNLETELDPAFNRQMEVLSWPRVTSGQFVQEQGTGRYVIMPATRMEIGRFIIENCPADARAYRFAALRYGMNVCEIANWVSEASD